MRVQWTIGAILLFFCLIGCTPNQGGVVEPNFLPETATVTDIHVPNLSGYLESDEICKIPEQNLYGCTYIDVLANGTILTLQFTPNWAGPFRGQIDVRIINPATMLYSRHSLTFDYPLDVYGYPIFDTISVKKDNIGNLFIGAGKHLFQLSPSGDLLASYLYPSIIDHLHLTRTGQLRVKTVPRRSNLVTMSIYDASENLLWSESEGNFITWVGNKYVDDNDFFEINDDGEIVYISTLGLYAKLDTVGNLLVHKELADGLPLSISEIHLDEFGNIYRISKQGVSMFSTAGDLLWVYPGLNNKIVIDLNMNVYVFTDFSVTRLAKDGQLIYTKTISPNELIGSPEHWKIDDVSYHVDSANQISYAIAASHTYDLLVPLNQSVNLGLDSLDQGCNISCIFQPHSYNIVNGHMTAIVTIDSNGTMMPTKYAINKSLTLIGSNARNQSYLLGTEYLNLDTKTGYDSLIRDNLVIY